MEQRSPLLLVKRFEAQINGFLSAIDTVLAVPAEQKLIALLRRELADVRLDIRDYELAESRPEQLRNAAAAIERLNRLQEYIVAASGYGIFGAADVAHLGAQVDYLIQLLR